MDVFSNIGIDLLLIIILVANVLISIHKGFFKSLVSLLCILLALIVASVLDEPVATWCYDSFISPVVVESIENKIPDSVDKIDLESTIESMPDFIVERLKDNDVDFEKTLAKISENELNSRGIAEHISERIISPVVVGILKLVSYLIILFVVRFLLSFVPKLVGKIAELPVINKFNKTIGGVLGFAKGLFIVFALAIALNFIAQLLNGDNVLKLSIENSFICDIISDIVK